MNDKPQPTLGLEHAFPGEPVGGSQDAMVVVRCLNPTTNKALHVGHLRNLSIGMAIAASFRATGIPAVTHTLLEDIGHFMAEGVLAYKLSGAAVPSERKPDQFIGSCYSDFRLGNIAKPKPSPGFDGGDVVNELLVHRKQGADDVVALWHEVTELAVNGQAKTLRKLGAFFDYSDFESGEETYLEGFIDKGYRHGVFTGNRRRNLIVGQSKAKRIELLNRFGHASENLYLLSFLYRALTAKPQIRLNIAVAGGREWQDELSAFADVLQALGVSAATERYEPVCTGMVMLNGRKVASRTGHGDLVDNVLHELSTSALAAEIAEASNGVVNAEQVSAVALRLFFLGTPRASDMEFFPALLVNREEHPAWRIARVWAETGGRATTDTLNDDDALMIKARTVLSDAAAARSFAHVVELIAELACAGPGGEGVESRIHTMHFLLTGLGIGCFNPDAEPLPHKHSLFLL